MIDPEALPGLLADHLPRQRWCAAAERQISAVRVRWCELVRRAPPGLLWALVDVSFADGETAAYQVFVGARPAQDRPEFLQGKDRELIGVAGGNLLYDALVDPELAVEVLHLVDPGREVEVPRPIVLEQTNSSIVYDESLILKVLRRVSDGPNPDVEITRTLAERGYPHVLAPLAELRRAGADLAVLREFLVGATEGWQIARASVRDLLASRLAPEECGADFAPDAGRLGALAASLHVAMAEAWGAEPGDAAAWSAQMREHLDALAARAGAPLPIPVEEVRQRYERLARATDPGAQIRIHGDLHLAQVIRADAGWFVIDFEGEPARRQVSAFTVSSPLRDVAGMLRSFHYVAATGRAEWGEDDSELAALASSWEARARSAFLAGYHDQTAVEALLPKTQADRELVLSTFELDKAVYELGYELDHRPDWAGIPIAAIDRLVALP